MKLLKMTGLLKGLVKEREDRPVKLISVVPRIEDMSINEIAGAFGISKAMEVAKERGLTK